MHFFFVIPCPAGKIAFPEVIDEANSFGVTNSVVTLLFCLSQDCARPGKPPASRAKARLPRESEMNSAIESVKEIVNPPVTPLVHPESMQVATYFGDSWWYS
jgi:hypothetical protein